MRLAQIEMESFATKKAIFSYLKTATRGSTFLGLEKKIFCSKIALESWKQLQKIIIKDCFCFFQLLI